MRIQALFSRFWRTPDRDRTDAVTTAAEEEQAAELICVRCGRPVIANRQLYHDVFERMHWLCFHLEFEHEGDPDLPCEDSSCHEWRPRIYEEKLRELGVDPEKVIAEAIRKRFG